MAGIIIKACNPFRYAYTLTHSLVPFIQQHHKLLVLTGAGVSTASGIPDYRDLQGSWKHRKPMTYQEFISSHQARQRYWGRSAIGWERFKQAKPNSAHESLAKLESMERVSMLITQNVDRLHSQAGSRQVIDLHGRLDKVICLDCGNLEERERVQQFLLAENPFLKSLSAESAPDGDAQLAEHVDLDGIRLPGCEHCGGVIKPHVVFFGENVPRARVDRCYAALSRADALLVVGSSLMVYSGFRFVRRANELGLPVAVINRGKTRADDLIQMKVEADCSATLEALVSASVTG